MLMKLYLRKRKEGQIARKGREEARTRCSTCLRSEPAKPRSQHGGRGVEKRGTHGRHVEFVVERAQSSVLQELPPECAAESLVKGHSGEGSEWNVPLSERRDRHDVPADFGVELERGIEVSRWQELLRMRTHLDLHLSEGKFAVRDHKVLDDCE